MYDHEDDMADTNPAELAAENERLREVNGQMLDALRRAAGVIVVLRLKLDETQSVITEAIRKGTA